MVFGYYFNNIEVTVAQLLNNIFPGRTLHVFPVYSGTFRINNVKLRKYRHFRLLSCIFKVPCAFTLRYFYEALSCFGSMTINLNFFERVNQL